VSTIQRFYATRPQDFARLLQGDAWATAEFVKARG
jgi:hypothetical protein